MKKTSSTHPLKIDVLSPGTGFGRIVITFCPGKVDPYGMSGSWDRCSETAKLDRFWLEFSAVILSAGGAENDESLEVFGRPERVHSQAGRRWHAGGGYLPQGRDQPGDLLQLEEKVRRSAAKRDTAAQAA